jgi:hypothetical protein
MSRQGDRGLNEEDIEGALFLPPRSPYPELIALASIVEVSSAFIPGCGPSAAGLCNAKGFLTRTRSRVDLRSCFQIETSFGDSTKTPWTRRVLPPF